MAIDDANSKLDKIVTELQRMNRSIAGSFSSGSSAGAGGGRSTDHRTNSSSKVITSVKREFDGKIAHKSLWTLTKGLKKTTKEIDDYSKSVERNRTHLHELYNTQTKLIKTIVSSDKVLNSLQDTMTHTVQDQLKNMSYLGKGVMEMAGTMKDVAETLESTEDLLKDVNDGLDAVGKSTLGEIKSKKDLVKFYGQMQHHLAADSKKSAEIQALIDKGKIESAKALIQQEINNANTIRDTTAIIASRYNIVSRTAAGVSDAFKKIGDSAGMGFFGQMATLGGSLALIGMGVKQAYTELWKVGESGLGGAYDAALLNAMKLGVSVESFAKTFQQNAGAAATMGFTSFVNTLKENQKGLMTLGLGQEEANKATMAFTQAAKSSGISLRDSSAVKKSIGLQTAAFEKMRAATGVTAEEYANQNKAIMESSVMQESLVRLGKTQRANALNEIMMTREKLRLMGMSNEQQVEFIKLMKTRDTASVSDRFKMGGDLVTAFSAIGRGDLGMEAFNLQASGQWGSERGIELQKILNANMAELKASGISGENIANLVYDATTASQGKDILNAAAIAKPNVATDDEINAAMAMGKVPDEIRDMKTYLGIAINALNSPLGKIGLGVAGILGVLVGGKIFRGLARAYVNKGLPKQAAISATRPASVSVRRTPGGAYRDPSTGRMMSRSAAHARIQSQYWNPKPVTASKPGLASRLGSGIKGAASATVGAVGAGISGAASMGGKALSVAGKVAGASLKAVPFIGWAYAAGSAIYDGFKAVEQANAIFGTQAATTSQKIAAGIGGAVESLTFGLLPTEATAKFVDGAWTAAKDIGSSISAGIISLYTSVSDTAKSVMGFIRDRAQAFKSWIGGKWDTAKAATTSAADRVGTAIRRGATIVREKYQEVTGHVPKFSDNVNGAINTAASKHGVDPKMMRAMAMIESTGNPNAVSSTNAKGLYQFVGGTAKQYGIKGNEFDASANADAAARLFKDNQRALAKRGIEANGVNTYMAHQLGAGGASKLIRAAESGSTADPALRKQMDLNGGKGKTPAEFYAMWQKKYNDNYALVNGVPGAEANVAAVNKPTIGKPVNAVNPTVAATVVAATGASTKEAQAAINEKIKQGQTREQAATSAQQVQKTSKDKLDLLLDSINELVALTREQNSLAQATMMESRVANLQTSFVGTGAAAAAQTVG